MSDVLQPILQFLEMMRWPLYLVIGFSAILVLVLVLGFYFLFRRKHQRKHPDLKALHDDVIKQYIRAQVLETLRDSGRAANSEAPKEEEVPTPTETQHSRRLIRRVGEK